MSGRRLPLFSAAELPAAPVSAARQVLPGRAVIVADTGADVSALTWAARFVEELGLLGRRVPVVLSSFTGVLAAAAQGRFEGLPGVSSVHLLDAPELAQGLPIGAPDDALWVVVGQPALVAARGWLSVLLAADAPALGWPAYLRALRGNVSLELSGAALDIATALARELAAADRGTAR